MSVLVIGDEVELAEPVASLRDDGHRVELARDAAAAMRLVSNGLDSVLVDLDVDGYQLVRALRTEVLAPSTSILALSSRIEPLDDAGVDLVLQKPLDAPHLGSLVEYITRRRHHLLRSRTGGPPLHVIPGPLRQR